MKHSPFIFQQSFKVHFCLTQVTSRILTRLLTLGIYYGMWAGIFLATSWKFLDIKRSHAYLSVVKKSKQWFLWWSVFLYLIQQIPSSPDHMITRLARLPLFLRSALQPPTLRLFDFQLHRRLLSTVKMEICIWSKRRDTTGESSIHRFKHTRKV